jgi:hypothetical protein
MDDRALRPAGSGTGRTRPSAKSSERTRTSGSRVAGITAKRGVAGGGGDRLPALGGGAPPRRGRRGRVEVARRGVCTLPEVAARAAGELGRSALGLTTRRGAIPARYRDFSGAAAVALSPPSPEGIGPLHRARAADPRAHDQAFKAGKRPRVWAFAPSLGDVAAHLRRHRRGRDVLPGVRREAVRRLACPWPGEWRGSSDATDVGRIELAASVRQRHVAGLPRESHLTPTFLSR